MCRAVRNAGLPGLIAGAVSAVDIALWDLKAQPVSSDHLTALARETPPPSGCAPPMRGPSVWAQVPGGRSPTTASNCSFSWLSEPGVAV
ncbi:hypothetical protein [Actinacidiphila glaucinigra]|uniref:hypothetical protein n=1 Tax=Actinacidiphila glaucinigra TaxID=235986 RepID=UPI003672B393